MISSGNQLRAARAMLGLDQEALAEKVGVSDNTIRNMEACGADPVGGFASTRDRCAKPRGVEDRISQRGAPGIRLRRGRKPAPTPAKSVKAGSGYPRQPNQRQRAKSEQPASIPRMSVIGSNGRLRQPSAFDADEQRHHFLAGDADGGDQRYQRPVFLRERSA